MALDYKSSLGRYRRYLQLVQNQPLWTASMWVILSLILLIVLTVLALRPTLVTISGLFGQIKQQREMSTKLDEKILKVRKAIDEMEAVKPDLPLLEDALPEQPDWEILANDIYEIATGSGVQITAISLDKIPLSPNEGAANQQQQQQPVKSLLPQGLMSIKFTLTAKGDYLQVIDVLSKLQKMRRVLLFSNVSVDEDKSGQLNLTVSGETGFIPDKYL